MLEIGTKAPDFTLPDQNGNLHSLSEYRERRSFYIFAQRAILLVARSWRECAPNLDLYCLETYFDFTAPF